MDDSGERAEQEEEKQRKDVPFLPNINEMSSARTFATDDDNTRGITAPNAKSPPTQTPRDASSEEKDISSRQMVSMPDIHSLAEEVSIVFDNNVTSDRDMGSTPVLPVLEDVASVYTNAESGPPTTRSTKPKKGRRRSKQRKQFKLAPPMPYRQAPPIHISRYVHSYIFSRHWMSQAFLRKTKITMLRSEANYIRMCKITLVVGSKILTKILKTFMGKLYPPKTLAQYLIVNKRKMTSFAATEKLVSSRWKLLSPDNVDPDISLEDFDLPLTYWFLRYICNFKRTYDRIWRWKPPTDDVSEVADVTRIRDLRNFLINSTTHLLFDEEFQRKINELSEVVIRVYGEDSADEILEEINTIQNEPPKTTEREDILRTFKKWAAETKDRVIEKTAPAKQGWDVVNECKGTTRRYLRRFRRPSVFVRTKAIEKAHFTMLKNGFVIIKGNTGEGKTTAAIAMMCSMFDEDEVLVLTKPDHWKYVDSKTVGCLLIDDLLGSMYLDSSQLAGWQEKFAQMYRVCKQAKDWKRSYLIITMRKHVYDQCEKTLSKYKLFSRGNVVEFCSKELNFGERRSLLSKHIMADRKMRIEIEKSARLHTSKLGYPQTCALYVSQDLFLDSGSHFFEYPIEVLHDELDRMYTGDICAYLTMVVMMFQPGSILFLDKLQNFSDEAFRKQFNELAQVCHVTVDEHLPGRCLLSLVNGLKPYVYYYDDVGWFTFVHESVMEIMMSSFVERHPQYVLETCELQFIMDYASTEQIPTGSHDHIFAMRMVRQHHWLLVQTFGHYISIGYPNTLAQHRAFRDPQFLQLFLQYLKENEGRAGVLLAQDSNVENGKGANKRKVGLLFSAINQDTPNQELAKAIITTGVHRQSDSSWAFDEVVASFHAAVKKGQYELYSLLLSQGLEIPDEFLIKREYLTSVDIIKDVLKRRSWSREQKDVALVRAARNPGKRATGMVALLLQQGATLGSIRAGTTALCEAVKSGTAKTVSLLLSKGASVLDRDLAQQTALHHACDWNYSEIVKLLLKSGADVNAADDTGFTPLFVAIGWGRERIIEILLTKRVNFLAITEQRNNILHVCAATGHSKVMDTMLSDYSQEMQTHLIAKNAYGWTPLDFAVRCGHFKTTKLLINAILNTTLTLKPDPKTFVHTRFNIFKPSELNFSEKYTVRFVNENSDMAIFRIPRCKWFIQTPGKEEYEEVRQHVHKYEDQLKSYYAKS